VETWSWGSPGLARRRVGWCAPGFEPLGDGVDGQGHDGDVEHELHDVVVRGVDGDVVEAEEDECGDHGHALVAVYEGLVLGERLQQRGRLEVDGLVGVLPEGGLARTGNGRLEEPAIAERDARTDFERVQVQDVLDGEVAHVGGYLASSSSARR
jgi:hypothetical protein